MFKADHVIFAWFTLALKAFPIRHDISAPELVAAGAVGGSAPRGERWQVGTPSPQAVQAGAGVTASWSEPLQD